MSVASILAALAPEWILLVGAGITLMIGLSRRVSRWASGCAFLSIVAALIVTALSDAPPGGEILPGLMLSSLSVYTRWITLSVGALVILVNWRQPAESERGEYMALILFSLLGLLLTAAANDLVVLFFAIELVSVPTYVLIALSRTQLRASEAAVKYFFLGALSAALLALGVAYLYGACGTTTIYTVAGGILESPLAAVGLSRTHATIGFLLLLAGVSFKLAAVPFHAYAADVYEGAAAPLTGMLGFVPKLAGIVALIKVLAAFEWVLPPTVFWTVWAVAAATMTAGNVLALLQRNAKRMLAYSSIAHTGYMLVAVLIGPMAGTGPLHDGAAAALFYIAVYGAMNLGAFALLASFRRDDRGELETLDELGGIAGRSPATALGFAVCLFSLMGIPPTAGFLGKVYIFSSAFSLDAANPMRGAMIALAVIGVLNTAVGAAYYLRLVSAVYIGPEPGEVAPSGGPAVRWGLALCSIPLILLFARPGILSRPAGNASMALREPEATQVRSAASDGPAVHSPAIGVPDGAPAAEAVLAGDSTRASESTDADAP